MKSDYDGTWARAYLTDGSSVTFRILVKTETMVRFDLYIDINGDKKPNKRGRDIFMYCYYIKTAMKQMEGKFVPEGMNSSRANLLSDTASRCNKNHSGEHCAALIMKDGWRIADDYPW